MIPFICGKAAAIFQEFQGLLEHRAMSDVSKWLSLWQYASDDYPAACAAVVMHVLEIATDFSMRIMHQVSEFPLRLAWLVNSPPETVCEMRQQVS